MLVVEATESGGAKTLLEYGPASLDGTIPASCATAGGSMLLDLSTCSCLISLNACCRIPEGADKERPKVMEGAANKRGTHYFKTSLLTI